MALTAEDVRGVGTLARLALDDNEVARLTPQLNDLLVQFARLQEIDTTDVPPTAHPVPVVATLREDVVRPSLPVARVLALSEHTDADFGGFIVPQVIGE